MSSERFTWALATGEPTAHLVRAALRAGALIDQFGSPVSAARLEYLLYQSDALYPPADLLLGQGLLSDCGLLDELASGLVPTQQLIALLALHESDAAEVLIDIASHRVGITDRDLATREAMGSAALDPEQRARLLLARRVTFDQAKAAALGSLGELHVVSIAQAELSRLGRSDLAVRVQRVSALSDQLGYDVVAPSVDGMRRLEVKTSGRPDPFMFRFYLSRLEYEVGLSDPSWALVGCEADTADVVAVVGWCRAAAVTAVLPADTTEARWATVGISLPRTAFEPGLPAAI